MRPDLMTLELSASFSEKTIFGGFPHAPVKFWLDNVSVKFSGKVLPPPHPTLSFTKQVNGLYVHSGAGDYERQEIRTVQNNA